MVNPIIKLFGTALSAIVLLFVLNSCETCRQDCAGQIIVENEIPDITLYVGGEPFYRDISEKPEVFSHTEKEITSISVSADNLYVVGTGANINKNNKRYIVFVEPRREGKAKIYVSAKDDCMDYIVSTTFNVTVIDTTIN